MLKYALLAGALTIGAPALAQDAMTSTPTPDTTQNAPAQQAPAAPASPDATAAAPEATGQTAPAEQAQAPAQAQQPASAGPAQVAEVVKAEFPTYDKDSSGSLNNAEFSSWMGALRKASEPTVDTASAEVKTWIEGAFASADADKNKSVTEGELTTFLTAGQPS